MDNDRTNYFLNAGSLFLAVILIVTGLLYGNQNNYLAGTAEANASDSNLSGFAWSGDDMNDANPATVGGIGWISFNCKDSTPGGTQDTCPGSGYGGTEANYGVNIDTASGINSRYFSGKAWSSTGPDGSGNPTGIGWINFAPDPDSSGSGCTAAPCAAKWNSDNTVTGWARSCSVLTTANTTCSGTAMKPDSERGGWDGWISLNCLNKGTCAAHNYGVYFDPSDSFFKGYAWGGGAAGDNSNFVGWINFNPNPGIGVGVFLASTPPDVTITANPSNPSYNGSTDLTWTVGGGGAAECHPYPTGGTFPYTWGNPSAKNPTGGSQTISNMTNTATFAIECTKPDPLGGGLALSDHDQVTVAPQVPFTITATSCSHNGSTNLDLNVSNKCISTITITPNSGFTGTVDLSAASTQAPTLPANAGYAFSQSGLPITSVTITSGAATAQLEVTIPPNTTAGPAKNVTVTGTSGSIVNTGNFTVGIGTAFKPQTRVEEI